MGPAYHDDYHDDASYPVDAGSHDAAGHHNDASSSGDNLEQRLGHEAPGHRANPAAGTNNSSVVFPVADKVQGIIQGYTSLPLQERTEFLRSIFPVFNTGFVESIKMISLYAEELKRSAFSDSNLTPEPATGSATGFATGSAIGSCAESGVGFGVGLGAKYSAEKAENKLFDDIITRSGQLLDKIGRIGYADMKNVSFGRTKEPYLSDATPLPKQEEPSSSVKELVARYESLGLQQKCLVKYGLPDMDISDCIRNTLSAFLLCAKRFYAAYDPEENPYEHMLSDCLLSEVKKAWTDYDAYISRSNELAEVVRCDSDRLVSNIGYEGITRLVKSDDSCNTPIWTMPELFTDYNSTLLGRITSLDGKVDTVLTVKEDPQGSDSYGSVTLSYYNEMIDYRSLGHEHSHKGAKEKPYPQNLPPVFQDAAEDLFYIGGRLDILPHPSGNGTIFNVKFKQRLETFH
ncbi:hypothetical protein JXB31_05835 [Candidatus Woesearchaeota archaeon]|nr:hypothetical protein [Candidatus Woesearchaeota archaeon]